MRTRSRPAALALRVATITLTVAVSAALAGCTGTGAPASSPAPRGSSQSIAEACDVVRASVADAAAELQQLDATDPQAAVAAMTRVADGLGTAADAVDNADVSSLLPTLQGDFTKTADILQAIAGGDLSQLAALQQSAGDIQASFEAFSELCPAP